MPEKTLRFPVGELLAGEPGKSRDYPISEVTIPLTESSTLKLSGTLTITKTSKESLIARGEFPAEILGECSRCLAPAQRPLILKLEQEYVSFPREDEEVLPIREGEVDLTEAFYHEGVINIPLPFLCRPDCRGICPDCGVNLNEEKHKRGCRE